MLPWLRMLMAPSIMRILVTIVGVVTVLAGLSELRAAFFPVLSRGTGESGDAADRS